VKLPEQVVISQDQLLRYLLLPREDNDTSKFLAAAGYTLATWEVLEHDLRQLAKSQEISEQETSAYGIKCTVRGTLNGPSGRTLHVETVWITLAATGETRFVTSFPGREVE
jgi:hypothetical protein